MKLLHPVVTPRALARPAPPLGRAAVVLASLLVSAACSPAATGNGGSSGGSGGARSGGSGGNQSGTGGQTPAGSGGASSGGATGSGGTVATGGTTGSGGGGAGTGGTTTADANPPDSVATDMSGGETGAPSKQFTCPAGPFPDDNIGARTPVCQGFQFRYNWSEGPTWIASQNAFFFSNFGQGNGRTGDIIKVNFATRQCEVFLRDAGCNGLAVGANGKLLGACHLTHSITEFDPVTKEKRVIVDQIMGRNLASPNDLVVHSNGSIYFTNPHYESIAANPFPQSALWVDPMGKISVLQMGLGNGIALSPDERTLHVVGLGRWALDANGVPGMRLGGGPGGDGISVNCAGKIFAPQTNSAFGGPDGKTMLIVANQSASFAQMNVPGLP
ncbi:MAG TPA: SMP-30/gluconolactonase/LRE family protein [Polyangia bacterium]